LNVLQGGERHRRGKEIRIGTAEEYRRKVGGGVRKEG